MKIKTIRTISLMGPILKIWSALHPRRRLQFFILILLTLLASLCEMVSISSLYSFISSLMADKDSSSFQSLLIKNISWVRGYSSTNLLLIAFVFSSFISGGLRVFLIWFGFKVSNTSGAELGSNLYESALCQKYEIHIRRNSSEIVSGLTQKISAVTSTINSVMAIITGSLILVGILFALMIIDPYITLSMFTFFGGLYVGISILTRKRLARNSYISSAEQTNIVKCIQEGLGSIRHVILDDLHSFYANRYRRSAFELQRAAFQNSFISQAPRFIMETAAILVIGLIFLLGNNFNFGENSLLPMIATFALGAQRLLPLLQQIYGNLTVIIGNKGLLSDIADLVEGSHNLSKAVSGPLKKFHFNRDIIFNNVDFSYGPKKILKNVNMYINKGEKVGIVGKTGGGKTSLIDILMGLLDPLRGDIKVDGIKLSDRSKKQWRKSISHVPQSIFLVDATVAENIALGYSLDQINLDLIRNVSDIALVSEFIDNDAGYLQRVGEGGKFLSGGQLQRIGIARALYKQADFIIMDEATSALDYETEARLMKNLNELHSVTILMIAHRKNSLKYCDRVYKIERGLAKETSLKSL